MSWLLNWWYSTPVVKDENSISPVSPITPVISAPPSEIVPPHSPEPIVISSTTVNITNETSAATINEKPAATINEKPAATPTRPLTPIPTDTPYSVMIFPSSAITFPPRKCKKCQRYRKRHQYSYIEWKKTEATGVCSDCKVK